MRQNYYCPNCGTPVICGARFCTGCGVNFQWISQSDLEQCSPASYRLPSSGPPEAPAKEQSMTDKLSEPARQLQLNTGSTPEKDAALFKGQETPFKAEVSKLLASLFDKSANCHRV
ncbi:MAG: zinc ribbon domain-containing protein [Dehalococcoidia bacterium]|nr:zinc ribbon domain-containing protein [Dehalococcoidia bacterium]